MKNKHVIALAIATLFLQSNVFSQEKYERPSYNEAYFSWGGIGYFAPTLLLSDAQKLAPGSAILQTDLSRFKRQFGYPGYNNYNFSTDQYVPINNSLMGGFVFEAMFGTYNLGKGEKRSPQMRFGVGYGSMQSFGSFWSNEVVTPYDTFVSGSGQRIITDSVFYESMNVAYSTSQVRVNADILFHTNPDRRFSFFIGAGLQAGLTFNNQTQVYYGSQTYLTTGDEENRTVISSTDEQVKNEWYNNKSGWIFGAYIPSGVNYRLGKTTPVLNQASLFVEFRPGVTAFAIPELQTYLLPYFQSNFGFRLRF
jgi:hypothetical protein